MATERITSRDNQRLVNARKVRDGKIANQIFIEGKRLAVEAFRSGVEVAECFLREGFHDKHLAEVIAERNCDVSELPDRIFESIADTKNSQGIVLIGKRPAHTLESIKRRLNSSPVPIVVVLTEINNPSNLGAVLRTAEAAGIAGVIVTENSADAYSAKTLRASMGAAFRLPIVEYANFRDILHWAKAEGITTTAAAATAPKTYAEDRKSTRLNSS